MIRTLTSLTVLSLCQFDLFPAVHKDLQLVGVALLQWKAVCLTTLLAKTINFINVTETQQLRLLKTDK